MIERGWDNIYFGTREEDSEHRHKIAQIISNMPNKENDWWACWKELEPKETFGKFNAAEIPLALCNPVNKKEIVSKH